MAELSNDGSGVPAVTSSASTLPVGLGQRDEDRGDRVDGGEHVGQVLLDRGQVLVAVIVPAATVVRVLSVVGVPGAVIGRLSRYLRSQGTNSVGHVGPLARRTGPGCAGSRSCCRCRSGGRGTARRTRRRRRPGSRLGEFLERVGELDLAAAARRGVLQHAEHGRVADVPADDDPVAGRVVRGGLLHQVGDLDHVVLVGRLDRGAAVAGHLVGLDLHQRDDRYRRGAARTSSMRCSRPSSGWMKSSPSSTANGSWPTCLAAQDTAWPRPLGSPWRT